MNFIKDLCEGKKDEYIHHQFIRFGKGQYERFLMKVKKGKNLSVKTSFDFSNELIHMIAEKATEPIEVKGKIVANYDFESEVEASKFSKRGKLYTAEFDTIWDPKQLKQMYEKFKNSYMLLTLKGSGMKLKCKNSLPKPGGKLKDNFCSATLPLEYIGEFAFDFDQNFKQAIIIHKLMIDDIITPEEYKKDFVMARQKATRKGRLIREIDLDGNMITKEYPLEV